MLTGALAAAATPLRDGGSALDPDAFGPMTAFLAAGGVDGILALGTTGEGILLSPDERKQAARLFVELRPDGFAVAPSVVERLREDAANLAGLKVSDSPMDRVRAYLIEGLDVFVGQEPLAID